MSETIKRLPTGNVTAESGTYDWLIVGAGFAGSVLAERLASQRGDKVLVIDRREHIAGNAFDHLDEAGVLIHRYGPHIFHTNSEAIFAYLSNFTQWRFYEHRVLATVKSPTTGEDTLVPMPINLDTINKLYGLSLTEDEVEGWMASRAEHVETVRTSEDVVVGKVGRELYEMFFRGYTRKQWALTRASSTRASRRACRRAPTATTATSPTASSTCRVTATPRCSGRSSRIRTSRCGRAWISGKRASGSASAG